MHLISRFEEDQILEIGTALFMIFSFLTVILHFFNKLLFFYILPLRSVSYIQVSRGRDNRPGLVDDHEKDESAEDFAGPDVDPDNEDNLVGALDDDGEKDEDDLVGRCIPHEGGRGIEDY